MNVAKTPYFVLLLIVMLFQPASSQTVDFQSQIAAWGNTHRLHALVAGARFIPQMEINIPFKNGHSIDFSTAGNVWMQWKAINQNETTSDSDLYRGWVRLTAPQWELRLGLQKINFGPARYLRPQMWFDSVDPRDPLQLTNGVYALLGRYYFANNANIWAWVLYGNNEIRGLDFFPSQEYEPEIGGRLQFPILDGEVGFSVHRREPWNPIPGGPEYLFPNKFAEKRIAIDGRWDTFIGIWGEYARIWNHESTSTTPYNFTEQLIMIGGDYTIPVGDGILLTGEYMRIKFDRGRYSLQESRSLAAITASIPSGTFDNFFAILYYDATDENWYRFFNWQQTYNHWQFNTIFFINPENERLPLQSTSSNAMSGNGLQLMVVLSF